MTRLDTIFFGLIIIMLLIMSISTTYGVSLPWWLDNWWMILLPVVYIMTVLPKSKAAKWLRYKYK